MRSGFTDCYMEFVVDLLYVYPDNSGKEPEVEDMITFLSRCTELERRGHAKRMFKMCCLCLSHWNLNIVYVSLGSAIEKCRGS